MKMARSAHSFCSAKEGQVAIIFALCSIPLLAVTGVGVDYARILEAQAQMQQASDATALMIMQNAPNLTTAQMQSEASSFFSAEMNLSGVQGVSVAVKYTDPTASSPSVTITSSGALPTSVMSMFGSKTVALKTTSTASAALGPRLRVALVLDNTGSMADSGKMTALQSASKTLLTQLQQVANTTADVYVSIVPFTTDVNVGTSNVNATWLDWSSWSGSSSSGYGSGYGSGSGSGWGQSSSSNHSSWNGCVTDRGNSSGPSSGNYDTNVVAPSTKTTATLFPADQASACPLAIKTLSNDWVALTNEVNSMTPNGNTNQAIGLAHGWMSLVGGGPYPTPPTEDPTFQYEHVIVLLTDGLNTQDRWYSNASSIDAREALTCTNVKNSGVMMYTIQVDTDGDPQSSVLQKCASDSSKFFLLTSSNQIGTVFQQIGSDLTKLRLTN